jgi:hypothetical protein
VIEEDPGFIEMSRVGRPVKRASSRWKR